MHDTFGTGLDRLCKKITALQNRHYNRHRMNKGKKGELRILEKRDLKIWRQQA